MYQKKVHSWKIVFKFKFLLSLIMISSQMFSKGMLASTVTKIMNTYSIPRTGGPFTKGPFSRSWAENWASLEFDLSA